MLHLFRALIQIFWKQGFCPGLTHGQRFGISYVDSEPDPQEESSTERETSEFQSHSVILISNPSGEPSPSPSSDHIDHGNNKDPVDQEPETSLKSKDTTDLDEQR